VRITEQLRLREQLLAVGGRDRPSSEEADGTDAGVDCGLEAANDERLPRGEAS